MKMSFTRRMITRNPFFVVIGALITCMTQPCAAQVTDPSNIDAMITPYYYPDSTNHFVINAGRFSTGLASIDEKIFLTTIREMKNSWNQLSFPELYVGAICLYNRGYRWESVYWFYTAQYRGKLFTGLMDTSKIGSIGDPSFELRSAAGAFHYTIGQYTNGFAGTDLKQLAGIVGRVLQESKSVPTMDQVYPNVFFVDKASWQSTNSIIAAGLQHLSDYLNSQSGDIANKRKSNGTSSQFANVTSKDIPLN